MDTPHTEAKLPLMLCSKRGNRQFSQLLIPIADCGS